MLNVHREGLLTNIDNLDILFMGKKHPVFFSQVILNTVDWFPMFFGLITFQA